MLLHVVLLLSLHVQVYALKPKSVEALQRRRGHARLLQAIVGDLDWREYKGQYENKKGSDVARVLYVTRHQGTLWDWEEVARRVDFPMTWALLDPSGYQGYGVWKGKAEEVWSTMGALLCGPWHVVIYCDTIVDARPHLQQNCSTPAILQVTNRFDYAVPDPSVYYALMRRVAQSDEHVYWVANNPFERVHIERKINAKLPMERYSLIRPLAYTPLTPLKVPSSQAIKVAVTNFGPTANLFTRLKQLAALARHLQPLGYHTYNGSRTLAKYAAVLHVPYQVSTMTFYEVLRYGGTFLLPTARYFKALQPNCTKPPCSRQVDEPGWERHYEWYNEEFRGVLTYFDSPTDLLRRLEDPATAARLASQREAGARLMHVMSEHGLREWAKVLHQATTARTAGQG